MTRIKLLKPIRENPEDFEALEKEIIQLLRREIYLPLIKLLNVPRRTIQNENDELAEALQSGKLIFSQGKFTGKLTGTLTKQLKSIGAIWDKKAQAFKLRQADLPFNLLQAIQVSQARFDERVGKALKHLKDIVPEEVAEKLNATRFFDRAVFKTNQKLEDSIKSITVTPELTAEQRKRIAEEYSENMKLYVQDFTEKETLRLRQKVMDYAGQGIRYESLAKDIEESFGVSQNKAKFLARQETSLLMTKFQQVRYEDSGVKYYKWKAVKGTAAHPTRKDHAALSDRSDRGELFRWDQPPLVDTDGQKKNPGQAYNCRCFAIPVVKF